MMRGPDGVAVLETLLTAGRHERPQRAPEVELSSRELEVLRLVGRGVAQPRDRRASVIAEATVKTHVRHVLEKLRIRNRAEAAAFAARWLPQPPARTHARVRTLNERGCRRAPDQCTA